MAAALVLSYLSPFVNPKITSVFSFFGLGYPFILLGNILFFFIWLSVKPKYAIMSGLMIAIGFGPLTKTIGFNKPIQTTEGLKIMSYNIGNSRFKLFKDKNETAIKEFRKLILSQKADIICVQERHPKLLDAYKKIFKGYRLYPQSDLGTAIYSKYPIIDSGNIPYHTNFHNSTWADVKLKNQVVRIYCTHLSSNHVPSLKYDVKEIWDQSKLILTKYHQHAQKRVGQLNKLLDHAEQSPHPIIISGDFNDMPQSYVYRMISKKYNDAFCSVGSGLTKTLKTRFIGLRIDYTFTSKEFKILNQQVIESDISDHFPIVTTLDLKLNL